ncbi:MAG: MaoC family dehydratase [Thermoanaerobaculia bacterium]
MRRFEDLAVGGSASVSLTVGDEEIRRFAELSGDRNPLHLDDAFAATTLFRGRIAHGMLSASLLSTLIGMHLPGTGAVYKSQTLEFLRPVRPGDRLTATGEITELDPARNRIAIATRIVNQDGIEVLRGEAVVGLLRDRTPSTDA